MQGSPRVIWGQMPLGMPYETQILSEEPQTKSKHLIGSKVMQGSPEVIWGQMPLGIPYETQIWSEEPQTKSKQFDGVKGHAGVTEGHLGS